MSILLSIKNVISSGEKFSAGILNLRILDFEGIKLVEKLN